MASSSNSFAFIVHPRDIFDTFKKYFWMKFLHSSIIKLICRYHPPLIGSKITGLKSQIGEPVEGYLLICPLTANQLINNRKLGKQKIKETISLAEKLGVKIIGIGALTPSITRGGLDLIDEIKVTLTHGRTLTVGMSLVGIKKIAEIKNIDLKKETLAIIGATGIIGEALLKLLIEEGGRNFILISNNEEKLSQLKKEITKTHPDCCLETSSHIHSIINAKIVAVATSSPKVLIHSEDLQPGAIVYDISQPQNTSPELLSMRKDILVIDGALVSTPGIDYHFDFGLPPETTFACLAETMLLAAEKKYQEHLVGKVQLERVKEMLKLAEKYNFTHAPFQSFGKLISIE